MDLKIITKDKRELPVFSALKIDREIRIKQVLAFYKFSDKILNLPKVPVRPKCTVLRIAG